MHENKYYHPDLHGANIMFTKTKMKTIKILNLNIPTFDYL